jgi:tetraacyldisaccharide-1-P 4'-kinase
LTTVDERRLLARLRELPTGPLREEMEAQVREVSNIRQRREEAVSRIVATNTGIDTLAVKAHSIALTSTGPDRTTDEVAALRAELNAYARGLEEVEEHLQEALPQIS